MRLVATFVVVIAGLAELGCGRMGFEPALSAGGDKPGQPGDPPTDPGDPALDLTGDGAADLAVVRPGSDSGVVELFTMAGPAPDPDNPTVQVEGSGECGPSGAARRVVLPGLGPGVIYATRCSSDRNYRVSVMGLFGPIAAGWHQYTDVSVGHSFGENQSPVGALALGDLDGDGTIDAAAGQPTEYLPPAPGRLGVVRVVLDLGGEYQGTSTTPAIALWGNTGEGLGAATEILEVTGDGVADLVVGASTGGTVYVVPGPLVAYDGPIASAPGVFTIGGGVALGFGAELAAWDADGDGVDELAIGVPGATGAAGEVRLYRAPVTAGASPTWTITGASGDELGAHLHARGDLDGDGLDDLAVGARGATGGAGAIMVFRATGSWASTTASGAAIRYTGSWPGATWARPTFVGDLDGDGRDDLAVVAPTAPSKGVVTVHLSAGGHPATGDAAALARWQLSEPAWGLSYETVVGR